jgi:hypothetical protein
LKELTKFKWHLTSSGFGEVRIEERGACFLQNGVRRSFGKSSNRFETDHISFEQIFDIQGVAKGRFSLKNGFISPKPALNLLKTWFSREKPAEAQNLVFARPGLQRLNLVYRQKPTKDLH